MRKQFLALTFLFVSTLNFCQNSKITVIYGKKGVSLNLQKIKDENILKRMKSIEKSFSKIEYKLIATKDEAFFQYMYEMKNDGNKMIPRSVTSGGMDGKYYSNLITKERLYIIENFDQVFIVKEPFNKYNWKILNDEKIIGGYNCLKAITTVNVNDIRGKYSYELVVWFSPKIPFSFGPASYFGNLPGLVLEVNFDNKIIIYAKKINLNSDTNEEIKKPQKGKKVNREEYNKIMAVIIDKIKNGEY